MVYYAVRADAEHGTETVIALPISTKYLITPYITRQDQVIYVEKLNVSCHFTELVIPKMYTGQRGPNLEYFLMLNRAIINVQGCILFYFLHHTI